MPLNNAVNAQTQGFQSLNTSTGVWNGRTLTPGTGITITNQDGTGGNPTISASSSPPDTSFGTSVIVDDFYFTSSGVSGDTNWENSGGVRPVNGVANHPGIVRIASTSSAGSMLKTDGATSNLPLLLANGTVTMEMVIRVPSTGANNIYLGLSDTTTVATTTEPANGVYFNYASGTNSGNWVGKTSSASSRSSANSNNTVTAGQWDRLKIVVNSGGTSVSFFVNGTEITNSPLATNIPTVDLGMFFTCSNLAVPLDVDLVTLKYVLAVSR
jgi:hypothetical protein